MKSGLTVTTDRTAAVLRSIKALTKTQVLVGVPAADAERDPEPGEPATMNNAALAYIHNFGSPAANIPARPFMEPGIANAEGKITAIYAKAAKDVLNNPTMDMAAPHSKVGLVVAGSIQEKITDGPFAPLADRTIAARKAKHGADAAATPLIDSGQLRRAITYVLKGNG